MKIYSITECKRWTTSGYRCLFAGTKPTNRALVATNSM